MARCRLESQVGYLTGTGTGKFTTCRSNFNGKFDKTFRDAQADTDLFRPRSALDGAPNILLVLIDDAGFGALSTFGGEGRLEKTIPGKFGFDEQDIGMDLSSPVSEDYLPPFKFTGTIKKVVVDLGE